MALPGELKGINGTKCNCGTWLPLKVYSSAAGYYLGYFCNCCGPYSRESSYFPSREAAEKALKGQADMQLRDTEYHG
jgi:hypothetical protein